MKSIKELPIPLTDSEMTWGLRYLMFQFFFLPSLLQIVLELFFPGISFAVLNFLYYLINLCALLWIFRAFLDASVSYAQTHIVAVSIAAAVGFCAFELSNIGLGALIGSLWPDFFNINDATISSNGQNHIMLTAIGTIVMVPLCEELLFRGLLFGMFRRRSRWLGYLISVVCFCSIHVMNYAGEFEFLHLLVCFVQYIPAGLVLAASYDLSGSIFAPVLIHAAVNTIGVLSMR